MQKILACKAITESDVNSQDAQMNGQEDNKRSTPRTNLPPLDDFPVILSDGTRLTIMEVAEANDERISPDMKRHMELRHG